MAFPSHPKYENMLEWHRDDFEPTAFEVKRVNQRLKKIKG
jgi:hypothetical protein